MSIGENKKNPPAMGEYKPWFDQLSFYIEVNRS